jgi:shikimate dehydrogenase
MAAEPAGAERGCAAPPAVRAAVLGSPIRHSLSPALHAAAYRHLGLDWRYEAIECTADGLPDLLARLGTGWTGLSLTMPLKEAVIGLLDSADPITRTAMAANTVLFRGGRLLGFNTDVPGMVDALAERELVDAVGDATIVGSGATARSAVLALVEAGYREIAVVARSRPPAETVARSAALLGARGRVVDLGAPAAVRRALRARLVICTLPAGGRDQLPGDVPERPGALFDVVYDPWPTALARDWSAAGGTVLSGLDLLVHQAVWQVQLMTGWAGPADEVLDVVRHAAAAGLKP